MSTATGKQAAAANEFLVGLHRIGVSRAQAIDSLHTVASEFRKPLITPAPGPAERSALACADALRAAATVLADHDRGPSRWTPTEVQYDHHATTDSARPILAELGSALKPHKWVVSRSPCGAPRVMPSESRVLASLVTAPDPM